MVDSGRELGISIRGGAEHGLGIYISLVEEGSVAEAYGLKVQGCNLVHTMTIMLCNGLLCIFLRDKLILLLFHLSFTPFPGRRSGTSGERNQLHEHCPC